MIATAAAALPDSALDAVLSAIEEREFPSLQWGYVDGSLSEDDVDQLARSALAGASSAARAAEVVDELVSRRLLFNLHQSDGSYRYRSRFAEGVRLLSRLKLLTRKKPWPAAPNLVSDFRVDMRRRSYPRRHIAPADVIARLGDALGSPLRTALVEALLLSDASDGGVNLSDFQLTAAREILRPERRDRGVVVSSGTGSGKTLAFYLPAFVELGSWVQEGERWTKALAVYPQRELLKDQFSEAFRMARRVDATLRAHGRRPITVGTFFGLTPTNADPRAIQQAGWPAAGGGAFVCPFLVCPTCGGELVWRAEDIRRQEERLMCRSAPHCQGEASREQITLTRRRAQAEPPDVVFTTAEMLNQRLSDTDRRPVLGIAADPARRARLVLLDEIHTYTGPSGAQTALVLRRWRHAVGRATRFVGLSATLLQAPEFLAQLTGVDERRVVEVKPEPHEMDQQSMAYQVVLRGDPASQTSLLSTSIQTGYLLARLMDPPPGPGRPRLSGGLYGHRVFAFTDDLDVTNRLFDDLRSAEGYNDFGRGVLGPLAGLRADKRPDSTRRDAAGQNWRACEELEWNLEDRLRVTRTTSQDAGVSATSNVIVATSALEIGFNDPTVGGVLQHKSPRQMAAYVQRRGRAGRRTEMRPWMVTVLSDYGRDRLTYQAYDQLFDPTLPPQQLPVRNQYILRMQAVFALMDWLAVTNDEPGLRGWWWQPLDGPTDSDWTKRQQQRAREMLRGLLVGDRDLTDRLTAHLRGALQLDEEEVASILWEAPRSLLLEVIPTLYRRLYTQWQAMAPGVGTLDLRALDGVHPLPDFVPANLFSDLSLPEVNVVVPPVSRNDEERVETMPIVQALRQLAPGRVTRRFAHERGGLSHWVPVPLDRTAYDLPVARYAEQHDYLLDVRIRPHAPTPGAAGAGVQSVPCYRPWTVRLEKVDLAQVSPSSNAFLNWSSQILTPAGEGLAFQLSQSRGWGEVVDAVEFHLHSFRSPATVRRFALSATAAVRRPGVDVDHVVETRFVNDVGAQAAVGFEQEVDGLVVRVRLGSGDELAARARTARSLPAWRTAYFRDRVLSDPTLSAVANVFQRDWLQQLYLSALVAEARSAGVGLAEARDALHGGDPGQALVRVMDAIFQMGFDLDSGDADGAADDAEGADANGHAAAAGGAPRLHERLADLVQQPAVQGRLRELAANLWSPEDSEWGAWLRARLHETLGEAALLACFAIAPRHAAIDTLLLDLDRGATDDVDAVEPEILITESTLGGAGVLDAIAHAFAAEPRALLNAIEAALAPNDHETMAVGLDAFLRLAVGDATVAGAVAAVRTSTGHAARAQALEALYGLLAERGLPIDHTLSVALNHRLLRSGIDATTDALLAELLTDWTACETRLGVAIDLRVYCFLAAQDPRYQRRLQDAVAAATGTRPDQTELVGMLSGILWPRPAEVRGRALESYNPFRQRGPTDPSLVRELLLAERVPEVAFGEEGWEARLRSALAATGAARLVAPRTDEAALHSALYGLLAQAVDVDFLQFYPAIEQVQRDGEVTSVTLVLREVAA